VRWGGVATEEVGPNTCGGYPVDVFNQHAPYLNANRRVWRCPSFKGREYNTSADYSYWYGWLENPAFGPHACSYQYLPWNIIGYCLFDLPNTGIYGQKSIRVGQDFNQGGTPKYFSSVVLLHDAVGEFVGYNVYPLFISQHFDRGGNLGANILRGNGSVEWFPWGGDRWLAVGNGWMQVQTWYQ